MLGEPSRGDKKASDQDRRSVHHQINIIWDADRSFQSGICIVLSFTGVQDCPGSENCTVKSYFLIKFSLLPPQLAVIIAVPTYLCS